MQGSRYNNCEKFICNFHRRRDHDVLENCRQVLAEDGRFIVVNSYNPEAGETDHNVARTGLHPGFRSIHIMMLCKMGNFRTKSEWLNLIDRLCNRVAF